MIIFQELIRVLKIIRKFIGPEMFRLSAISYFLEADITLSEYIYITSEAF